jgi:hypothetical protein
VGEDVECIVCHRTMPNLTKTGMQPSGGTCFETRGHYGSAVTDMMDGTSFEVCVCDRCMDDALRTGAALRCPPKPN